MKKQSHHVGDPELLQAHLEMLKTAALSGRWKENPVAYFGALSQIHDRIVKKNECARVWIEIDGVPPFDVDREKHEEVFGVWITDWRIGDKTFRVSYLEYDWDVDPDAKTTEGVYAVNYTRHPSAVAKIREALILEIEQVSKKHFPKPLTVDDTFLVSILEVAMALSENDVGAAKQTRKRWDGSGGFLRKAKQAKNREDRILSKSTGSGGQYLYDVDRLLELLVKSRELAQNGAEDLKSNLVQTKNG